jgi:6-phosphogluconolactonase
MSFLDRERPPGVRERRFDGATALATTMANDIGHALAAALGERASASLVVSGGKSPVPLFRQLRRADIDWSRVRITLADERWVPPDDPQSNEGLVRRELLQQRATAANFTGLKNDAPTAQQGAAGSWAAVAQLPRPFDVLVLGMGTDGHTASLFPGSPGITQALDPDAVPACVAMSAPVAPHMRMSMNLAALLQSRRVLLQLDGERKWEVYREAARLAANATGGPDATHAPPVTAVLRPRSPGVQVYWAPAEQ